MPDETTPMNEDTLLFADRVYNDVVSHPRGEGNKLLEPLWEQFNPEHSAEKYSSVINSMPAPMLPSLLLFGLDEAGIEKFDTNGIEGVQRQELQDAVTSDDERFSGTDRMLAVYMSNDFERMETINDADGVARPDDHLAQQDVDKWAEPLVAESRRWIESLMAMEPNESSAPHYKDFAAKIQTGFTEHDVRVALDADNLHRVSGGNAGFSLEERFALEALLSDTNGRPPSLFKFLATAQEADLGTSLQPILKITPELGVKFGMDDASARAVGNRYEPLSLSTEVPGVSAWQFPSGSYLVQSDDGDSLSFNMYNGIATRVSEGDGKAWVRDAAGVYRQFDADGAPTGNAKQGFLTQFDAGALAFLDWQNRPTELWVPGEHIALPPEAVSVRPLKAGQVGAFDESDNLIFQYGRDS